MISVKVMIGGGGTAGHINPALSIAKKLAETHPGCEILFVGTPGGMENRLVGKAGFPIEHVRVMGFKRKLGPKELVHNVKAAYYAVTSVSRAKKIIKDFGPDLVIGTGGYVSWPLLKGAADLGIPTLIHEQNAVPGVTTRKLSAYVDRVMISFEETAAHLRFPERAVLCGNPVDPAILRADPETERKRLGVTKPFILSYGGSLGARPVNEAVYGLIKHFSSRENVIHCHAFGVSAFEQWKEKAVEDGLWDRENLILSDYIYDMPSRMAACDLVISRAGAITLAELAALGKPAILIPSPYVTDNHQYKNARVFSDAGAAVLIEEKELTPELLENIVRAILSDPARRGAMAAAMKKLARRGAQDTIISEIEKLLKKTS